MLSVIVPVFQAVNTLEKCVASIIAQDMDDMEIIGYDQDIKHFKDEIDYEEDYEPVFIGGSDVPICGHYEWGDNMKLFIRKECQGCLYNCNDSIVCRLKQLTKKSKKNK